MADLTESEASGSTKIVGGDEISQVDVKPEHGINQIQVKGSSLDLRLLVSYQAKILEQLEKLNTYMAILTDEDL